MKTKKTAKNKRKLNISLGDKLLILTAAGVIAMESLQYFYLKPQATKPNESQKIATEDREETSRDYRIIIYNPKDFDNQNKYEPNNFESKTGDK